MLASDVQVHPTAIVDPGAHLGAGTRVWHFAHVCSGAQIGPDCSIGQGVYIAPGVRVGKGCKIQNNVSLYEGVTLEDFVFCGPSCVFTNVINPRSEIPRKTEYRATVVRRGATIGANATIVCGVEIGRYAFVAAGAVVTRNVPDYGLVVGVPATLVGYMSRHGFRLRPLDQGTYVCPHTGWRYVVSQGSGLRCLDWPEDRDLRSDGGRA